MSEFVAGFAARHQAAAHVLAEAFAPTAGFASVDIRARRAAPPSGPRHFSPADRETRPTEGWDPLDPAQTESPYIDPLQSAHAAGYAEGFAAAQAALSADTARDRALLDALGQSLGAGGRLDRDRCARQMRHTVLLLVARLVGEIGISPERLAERIDAATELLADEAESALLRVHPDDVALLEGRLPRNLFAAGDASVVRGSFVLESASTIVEDGPELWLEQLTTAIDRASVPTAC